MTVCRDITKQSKGRIAKKSVRESDEAATKVVAFSFLFDTLEPFAIDMGYRRGFVLGSAVYAG